MVPLKNLPIALGSILSKHGRPNHTSRLQVLAMPNFFCLILYTNWQCQIKLKQWPHPNQNSIQISHHKAVSNSHIEALSDVQRQAGNGSPTKAEAASGEKKNLIFDNFLWKFQQFNLSVLYHSNSTPVNYCLNAVDRKQCDGIQCNNCNFKLMFDCRQKLASKAIQCNAT